MWRSRQSAQAAQHTAQRAAACSLQRRKHACDDTYTFSQVLFRVLCSAARVSVLQPNVRLRL